MTAPSTLSRFLETLPRLSLIAGKGGVGKTTIAAGLAAHLADNGRRTLLVSTDPASALGDAIGERLFAEARAVAGRANLEARQILAEAARTTFLDRWRDVIVEIVDRGTYLDRDDITGLVDTAMPGADEIFSLLELAVEVRRDHWERIVVDTAPTGHTLRLLALPRTFEALVALLNAMQEKHRFMVRALVHRYRRDAADDFIDEMQLAIRGLREALFDPSRAAAVLVTRAEPVVVAESARYAEALNEAGVRVAGVIVNALGEGAGAPTVAPAAAHFALPCVAPPIGIDAAATLVAALRSASDAVNAPRSPESRSRTSAAPVRGSGRRVDVAALTRELTIVGGKGGVGKTTVSCALAIASAEAALPTLLVSTDPAPSIADALSQPIGEVEQSVRDVPGLVARQMDASAGFARFRAEYESRIDALFGSMVSRGVDVAHDRAIMRDLLALAPPGVDEVYALSELGETLAEHRFARVIVDPAPTGHLLRLLSMPSLALEWSHRLMRLMLKYKEIAGLGDAAGELLAFAKRTRALETLLHDPARAGLVLVALDEPLVRLESERLERAVRQRDIDIIAIVWNRTTDAAPLPTTVGTTQLCAPLASESHSTIGVNAIRAWSERWRALGSQ